MAPPPPPYFASQPEWDLFACSILDPIRWLFFSAPLCLYSGFSLFFSLTELGLVCTPSPGIGDSTGTDSAHRQQQAPAPPPGACYI